MFKLEINIIFWTLVSFGVVYWVVCYKIYPPLAKIMQERADKIAADLGNAAKQAREAEKLRLELTVQQKQAEREAQRLLAAAREKAGTQMTERLQVLQAEFAELRRTKEAELQRTEAEFYRHLDEHAGQILYKACEKVVRCKLTPEMQQQILTERLTELKKLKEL